MPIRFAATPPETALLVVLACGVALFVWRVAAASVSDLTPRRRHGASVARLVLLALVLAPLAHPAWVALTTRLCVVFAIDSSRSIQPGQSAAAERYVAAALRGMRPGDQAAVATFAAALQVHLPPTERLSLAPLTHAGNLDATDLGGAVAGAASLVPPGAVGKVVLLSDGNDTAGRALADTSALAASGVSVDTVPLAASLRSEVLVEGMEAPARAAVGQPFEAVVTLRSLGSAGGRLTVTADGATVAARRVDMRAGRTPVTVTVPGRRAGACRLQAILLADRGADTWPQNNRGAAIVVVRSRPRVLYAAEEHSTGRYLGAALGAHGIDLVPRRPADMPSSAQELQRFDAILLADAPASAISDTQAAALLTACRDLGVGLGMVGGESSFGVGGYRGSPLEAALPVRLDIRDMRRIPPVSVALAIDRSSSMEEGAGPGRRKLDLALEAAARAVEALKPDDRMAVVAFAEAADTVVPLTRVTDRGSVLSRIAAITTGGGTSVYSGLAAAFEQVRGGAPGVRHIILLTDGQSNDPDYGGLVRRMRAARVTLTCVAVGGGTGSVNEPLLSSLAAQCGGRFFRVDRVQEIPRIYLQEIQRISSRPIIERSFVPIAAASPIPLPRGVGSSLPPLLGYNLTRPAPGANVLLRAPGGDPVLALGRYGLGRTLAFTSDAQNRWGVHWVAWRGYPAFWAQAMRWLMRPPESRGLRASVTVRGSTARIVARAVGADGRPVDGLALVARVAGPGGAASPSGGIPLAASGPGRYEAAFDAAQPGSYAVNVVRDGAGSAGGAARAALVVPYPPEYRTVQTDRFLLSSLARAAGGEMTQDPARAFGERRAAVASSVPLWRALVLLALLLLPCDVAVRRLVGRRALGSAPLATAGRGPVAPPELPAPRRAGPPATPGATLDEPGDDPMGRLLAAKRRATGTASSEDVHGPSGE
ncbi:MAG: VWA domain-containing protein [Chthonomonadales bacterium]|nr:VWA domain-containing protein [Chthonomonadales bacterium]